MKSDFLLAITQLSAEKNLSKDVVLAAVENALVSAYRKDNFAPNQNISVKIDQTNGHVIVWAEKTVVETPADTRAEISLADARRIKKGIQLGEVLTVEATPQNAGRIAAQTAKQVILQRLHEAEHTAILDEFAGREGDVVSGVVQRIEPRQVLIDLGRTEGVLPPVEQVSSERYRVGQRLRAIIMEVAQTGGGPKVVLSRSHPNFLRRLFEMEVPEFSNGVVEVKSIAREAGSRSKVAVASRQEGVDPVGCCVGLRGIRIQNIVNELHGEKIDVVLWNVNPATFIASALSPAQIVGVALNKEDNIATVVVPDRQLSLAIGREGQNVRLAAKLSGWRIDIKGLSVVEAEKAEVAKAKAAADEAAGIVATPALEPVLSAVETSAPGTAIEAATPVAVVPVAKTVKRPTLRFAEEILTPAAVAAQIPAKTKKKKKGGKEREGDDVGRGRKVRDELDVSIDEEIY